MYLWQRPIKINQSELQKKTRTGF